MQMNNLRYLTIRAQIVVTLFVLSTTILCGISYAGEQPQPGDRYKIVGPMYVSGIYKKLNNRQINRQMAVGSLTAVRFSGPEVAFQCEVPVGTIMTIIGPAPKSWYLPFSANRFFIRLDPDLAHGIDVVLEIGRAHV